MAKNKILLTKKTVAKTDSSAAKVSLRRVVWYWSTLAVSIAAVIMVLLVPENSYPLAFIRYILSLLLVLFLPGFALTKALLPTCIFTSPVSGSLEIIARIALSIGTSIAITPILGLLLYHSPWGLGLVQTSLGLLFLIILFSTISLLRMQPRNS